MFSTPDNYMFIAVNTSFAFIAGPIMDGYIIDPEYLAEVYI